MKPMQEKKTNQGNKGRSRRKGSRPTSLNPAAGRGAEQTRDELEDLLGNSIGRGKEKTGLGAVKIAVMTGCVTLGLLAAAGAAYAYMGQQYEEVFFPKTIINHVDVSGRSVEEVKRMIAMGIEGYTLTLEPRGGGAEVIRGAEIDLRPEYDGTMEQILDAQEPLRWGIDSRNKKEYTIGTMMVYDRQKLEQAVNALPCMDSKTMMPPTDARLSDYTPESGYRIIPEELGNQLQKDAVLAGVEEAVKNMTPKLSLEKLDAYVKPEVTSEDAALNEQLDAKNKITRTTVIYQFGKNSEVLDGRTTSQWLKDDGNGGVEIDREQVVEYVRELAKNHNTAYQPKTLRTFSGQEVKIVGGPYGWRINQGAEVEALTKTLYSGQREVREPVYSQKAASHDGPDYGNTYVEINLTAQHLWFYKDGKLLVESDFVSGNASKGWSTPAGAYPLTYKQRNATLKGENYATPVSYWMPFNGNIGMHDANWRSEFGGTIYKTSGSHGCVNLPPSAAKIIYDNISAGIPVLCYELAGTEQKGSAKPEETKPAETKPAETKPAETKAPETKPAETKPAETQTPVNRPAEVKPEETKPAPPPVGMESTPDETKPAAITRPSGTSPEGNQPSGGTVSGPAGAIGGSASSENPAGPAGKPEPERNSGSAGPAGPAGNGASSGVVSAPGE